MVCFCKAKFAFEAKHAPYELDIFSLPAEVAKRHESVRKQLSVVFPRVCILKEYCQARRWNIQLVHKACFFINIIPSGKHEPQRDGGPSPTVEGECGAFKSAIAYSLRILLPSPKGATFLPEEGIDRGTDFAKSKSSVSRQKSVARILRGEF